MRVKTSQNKTHRKTVRPDVKKQLLKAAKKQFALKGLSGTSIRDIANEAHVNSSMISYYFESKEGLYVECLREIGKNHLKFAKEVLIDVSSLEEFKVRLQMLINNLFSLYTEDRDAGLIIVREYDKIHSPAEKVFKQTFLKIFELLIHYFEMAQKKNFVNNKKDPFILGSLFFGCLSSQMRMDHIKEKAYQRTLKQAEEREKVAQHLVELFLVS
ncbi:MAG: TetR/AcrR family transcriptional regulator [Bdellovibrionaceae bacterium]|nr:TetR/AcrR family transcriptional regulator [Pseudobdellovibrionaceae bacterium]